MFNYFPSATQPNCLLRVRITILIMALTTFLTRFLQCFLELLNFFGELHKVVVYRITFLSAFLSGMKIRFLLSILFKPTTITSIVHGVCAPMLLAQVAMLLKADFLGNPDRGIGTRALHLFLTLVRRLLGRFQFALLVVADAFDCFQQSQKQAHVHRRHALLIHVVLVLPLEMAHMQYMSPKLSLRERDVLGLGAGIGMGAVMKAWQLDNVGIELLYMMY
jgi:hypothetical protein